MLKVYLLGFDERKDYHSKDQIHQEELTNNNHGDDKNGAENRNINIHKI
jgi:hypothetical protein